MPHDPFEQNQATNPTNDVMSESATEKKAKALLGEARQLMERHVDVPFATDDLSGAG